LILVDSSVWVDYFRGVSTAQTKALDRMLGYESLVIGDLMLAELLQGFSSDRDFDAFAGHLGLRVVLKGVDC